MYLRYIDLSYNYITKEGGIPLVESLSKNDTIHTLILNNNNLGDETA